MLQDYSNYAFNGQVSFPKFPEGGFLRVGSEGVINPVTLPYFRYEEFIQSTPSAEWSFIHDFGIIPFALVLDDSSRDITYGVNIFKDSSIVRVTTEGVPLTGKLVAYSLGFSPQMISDGVQETWISLNESGNLFANTGYAIASNNVSDVIDLILPLSAQLGDVIRIVGETFWRIKQNPGQSIRFGEQITTNGINGSLAATQFGDCVDLRCINFQRWMVVSSEGNLEVI